MASTQKLPSGKYRGVYRDSAGHRKYTPATRLKEDARTAANEAEVIARRQAAANDGTLSPKTAWGDWWDILAAERTFTSNAKKTETSIVKAHLRPEWGTTALVNIKHHEVQAWADRLVREGNAISYVHGIVGLFRLSLNAALDRGVLTASPAAKIRLPKIPNPPKKWIGDDRAKLLEKMRQPYRDVLELMLETGARPNEVCGLHDGALNSDGMIMIRDVLVTIDGVLTIRPWPKDDDTRWVPATRRAKAILDRNLEGRDRKVTCGLPHLKTKKVKDCKRPLVFIMDSGEPVTPAALADEIERAAKAAQLPHTTPYAARRGYGTRLARAGVDPFTIMALMGHSDTKMTAQYVQTDQAAIGAALTALGDPQPLRAVPVSPRDTRRETDPDSEAPPEAPSEDAGSAG